MLQTLSRVETLNRNFDKSISSVKEAAALHSSAVFEGTWEAGREGFLTQRPLQTTRTCRRSCKRQPAVDGCSLQLACSFALQDRRGEAEALTYAAEASLSRLNAEARLVGWAWTGSVPVLRMPSPRSTCCQPTRPKPWPTRSLRDARGRCERVEHFQRSHRQGRDFSDQAGDIFRELGDKDGLQMVDEAHKPACSLQSVLVGALAKVMYLASNVAVERYCEVSRLVLPGLGRPDSACKATPPTRMITNLKAWCLSGVDSAVCCRVPPGSVLVEAGLKLRRAHGSVQVNVTKAEVDWGCKFSSWCVHVPVCFLGSFLLLSVWLCRCISPFHAFNVKVAKDC